MNTLIALSIAPLGVGEEVSQEVAQVIRVLRESGLPCHTHAMTTEIEGPWDDVMALVKKAAFVLAEKGLRTQVFIKADIRPGYTGMMESKVQKIEAILGSDDES